MVKDFRVSGLSLNEIAQKLSDAGIPTAHGGRWYPETIRRLINRSPRLT